ncbi:MAG: prepilin-type N-terminal cleavage/methylation domain-containing protein [Burkholderiaceae bacterium]
MKASARNAGFTLIELMIVVAIIGILAAIAVPAYQDNVKRSYVTNGLSISASYKALVSENAVNASVNLALGTAPFVDPAGVVTGVSVDPLNGEITISFSAKVEAGATLLLVPNSQGFPLVAGVLPGDSIMWTCGGAGSTLSVRFRPASCR